MPDLRRQMVEVPFKGKKLAVSVLIAERSDAWIVGLHGLQSSKALFVDLFAQPFLNGYSLLAIDFIGFGESAKPEDFSYDIEDQAEVVKHVLDYFKIKRLHLIGHSMGGMVGTLLLPKLGDALLSFINLEGNLTVLDCGVSKDVIMFSWEEFENVAFDDMRTEIRQSSEKSAASRSQWLDMVPAWVFYETSLSIVDWSKSGKLRDIFNSSPVKRVFMYGSENAGKAQAVSDSVEKIEISEAGHFMLLDQPERCFQAIGTFIQ